LIPSYASSVKEMNRNLNYCIIKFDAKRYVDERNATHQPVGGKLPLKLQKEQMPVPKQNRICFRKSRNPFYINI